VRSTIEGGERNTSLHLAEHTGPKGKACQHGRATRCPPNDRGGEQPTPYPWQGPLPDDTATQLDEAAGVTTVTDQGQQQDYTAAELDSAADDAVATMAPQLEAIAWDESIEQQSYMPQTEAAAAPSSVGLQHAAAAPSRAGPQPQQLESIARNESIERAAPQVPLPSNRGSPYRPPSKPGYKVTVAEGIEDRAGPGPSLYQPLEDPRTPSYLPPQTSPLSGAAETSTRPEDLQQGSREREDAEDGGLVQRVPPQELDVSHDTQRRDRESLSKQPKANAAAATAAKTRAGPDRATHIARQHNRRQEVTFRSVIVREYTKDGGAIPSVCKYLA
jgi:hypothetical protein